MGRTCPTAAPGPERFGWTGCVKIKAGMNIDGMPEGSELRGPPEKPHHGRQQNAHRRTTCAVRTPVLRPVRKGALSR